jgi:hypothetical protein
VSSFNETDALSSAQPFLVSRQRRDCVVTGQQCLEETLILFAGRIEGTHGLAATGSFASGDRVQLPDRRAGVVDDGQRVELTCIGGQRDVPIAEQVGDACRDR